MKRIMIGIVVAVLLTAGSGVVYSEEKPEVEAGVKLWYNKWEFKDPVGTLTTDYTMLIGPAVRVMFPNYVFLEGTFLFSTADYKFPDDTKFDRRDLEVSIGYMITDQFGLFAAYKNVWFKETDPGGNLKESLYGPMIGALVNLPIDQAFSFYGNVNYLFTRFKFEDGGSVTEDSPGWILEAGFKYAFTREFSGRVGYKYETNKGKDTDVRDTFTGVTIGALFTF